MAASRLSQFARRLFKNWWLKLLALLLATISFYAIRGETSFEVLYDVPLSVEVDPGIAILDQNPRVVQVTFRGSQDDLYRLQPQALKAVVRPSTISPDGSERVDITDKDIEGGTGVRVVSIRPAAAMLTFDRETAKRVPIAKPMIVGKPLVGRVEIDYEPKFVTIRGPRRRLERTETLTTEPIDVDGRVDSFSKRLRVLSPSDSWISKIDPAEITVRASVVTETGERVWERVPVMAFVTPGAVADTIFDPTTVQVTLRGPEETLESIGSEAVMVFVDCVELDESATYELPVNVHLPPGVELSSEAKPAVVSVRFRKRRAKPGTLVPQPDVNLGG